MNLRIADGKVPVWVGGDSPYTLVNVPSKGTFLDLYPRNMKKENLFKYWEILVARSKGATLEDAGRPFGITKERVRQIEAKFLRLFSEQYWRVRSSSMTDSQGSSLPEHDNR